MSTELNKKCPKIVVHLTGLQLVTINEALNRMYADFLQDSYLDDKIVLEQIADCQRIIKEHSDIVNAYYKFSR